MDLNWWTGLSLTDIQQSKTVLSAFTDPKAERPEPFDDIVRAFCIKVLFEGEAAANLFVNQLETINAAQLELFSKPLRQAQKDGKRQTKVAQAGT